MNPLKERLRSISEKYERLYSGVDRQMALERDRWRSATRALRRWLMKQKTPGRKTRTAETERYAVAPLALAEMAAVMALNYGVDVAVTKAYLAAKRRLRKKHVSRIETLHQKKKRLKEQERTEKQRARRSVLRSISGSARLSARRVYHVTSKSLLPAIRREGLIPQCGDRMKLSGDSGCYIHVFSDRAAAEDAVMNWLGDEFPDEDALIILEIDPCDYSFEHDFGDAWKTADSIPFSSVKRIIDLEDDLA